MEYDGKYSSEQSHGTDDVAVNHRAGATQLMESSPFLDHFREKIMTYSLVFMAKLLWKLLQGLKSLQRSGPVFSDSSWTSETRRIRQGRLWNSAWNLRTWAGKSSEKGDFDRTIINFSRLNGATVNFSQL